jgi:GWxTD domain-containing protein
MKNISLVLCISLGLSLSLRSAPDVSIDISRFQADPLQYIEISLYIIGSSLSCDPQKTKVYGVEYVIIIRDSMDQVVAGNRYRLSKEGCPAKDLIDVKRFSLSRGAYTVEIEANDLVDSFDKVTILQEVVVEDVNESGTLSDIQLLSTITSKEDEVSSLHKSGLILEPLPFRFYYPALTTLYVYLETYHAEKLEGQPYLQYTIKPLSGDIPSPVITYKKINKEAVASNVLQLDISTLLSGPYILEAALFDGNKQLQEIRKVGFSRFNPKGDSLFIDSGMLNVDFGFVKEIPEDSLEYDLRAIAPIVNPLEMDVLNSLIKKGNTKSRQFFLHKFWVGQAGKLAGPAFYSYMKVAKVVDENYRSGFGYGFETDRGYVFLKYGKPDEVITVEDEPSAPPYEIWFYTTFSATHQTNVRFLFYNPSLVRNGFQLLHSTARGEKYNDRWEVVLYQDATQEIPGVNSDVMGDNVYRNAREYFEH